MSNIKKMLSDFLKGILLSVLYLQLTKANDTTIQNVLIFSAFYVIMVNGATFAGVDPLIVTNAFITKTVFTLIDERIKKPEDEDINKQK